MKKSLKKIVAIVISIIMIVCALPITANATDICNSSNLKLRWLASEDYATDTTSGGRNAITQGTVNWANVNGYNAATFNNSDIYYTVSTNLLNRGIAGSVEGGSGTTIAFMAYVNSSSSSSPFFCIFNNNYGTSGYKTLLSYAPNGSIVYTNSAGTAKYSSTSASSVGWHTYVIKFYSSKSMEIYVDGSKVYGEQSDFYDNHTFDVPNSIKLGVNRENTAYYSGAIRDFRIYNSDLNATTVHNNLLAIAEESNLPTISAQADTNFVNTITNSSMKVSYVQPTIGGVGIENKTNRTYYRNILYCSNSFVANTNDTLVNKNSTYGYILMPSNTLVVYDGVTAPIIPIKASFNTSSYETGGYSYSTFAAIYLPSTPAFSLDNTWIGLNTANCNRFNGWPSDSGSTNQLGNTNVRSGNICQTQSYTYEIGFKNGLVMNSIPSSNPKTSIPFTVNQTGNESYTITSSGNVYYIDITGLKSAIANAKSQAITIANKYNKYTTASYNSYKEKTSNLLNFNINSNLQTTLGMANAVSRINNAITTAINEYNDAYSNLKKIEIAELHYMNGETTLLSYDEGDSPTLPESNVAVSNNDGTHCYLGWDKGDSRVVDEIKYTTYTQSKTSNQNCMYNSSVTQEASCTKPKITTYTCLICQYSYNETGDKIEHQITYTDMKNGTHTGVCSLCHELSTYVTEQHSFTNYVNNDDATCTTNGTKTATCDKCNATDTVEIPNSLLGHSYNQITVNPTCTEDGYDKLVCTICGNEEIVDGTNVDKLGHSYIANEIASANCISNGIVEYTCEACNDKYFEYTDINKDSHNELIYARTVDPTETEDGYDIYYCSNLCGYWEKKNIVPAIKQIDLTSCIESYNLAKITIVSDFTQYTASSVDEYNGTISSLIEDAEQAIIDADANTLDACTKAIIEASAILRVRTLSVSICNGLDIEIQNVSYGQSTTISVSQMSKVTIEQNGVTKVLCYADDDINYTFDNDAIIEIYPTNIKEASNRIAVLDKNENVISYIYDDIDNVDLNNLSAPKIPFYQFDRWQVVDDNTIKATYRA